MPIAGARLKAFPWKKSFASVDASSFFPSAKEELDDAALYYDQEQPGLGDRFLTAVERSATQLGRTPTLWPALEQGIRRCLLTRFPYALIYSVEDDLVYVIAVAHQHRRPGYWHDRIPPQ